jgi:thiamine-phosphate pyrophosphorylase
MMKKDPRFQLHMITDGIKQADELQSIVQKALRGGADAIQLRYKSASALEILSLGRALKPLTDLFGARLLINDRLDVALALQASGVHLAGKSLPVDEARKVAGPDQLLGCSVHSAEEAKRAEELGASYVTFGHIFPTHSKPGLPPRGVEGLQEVVEALSIPVLAIGGITVDNIDDVLATGCAGIAVIGAISYKQDPEAAARQLRNKMDASPHRPRFVLP